MNRVARCSINWIWLANKSSLSAPKGSLQGHGPHPPHLHSMVFCNGWNSYFSNVNFPLRRCHLKMSLGEDSEGRGDISGITSCSARRCLSDLVHDMPPCFSVSCSRCFQTPVCLTACLSPPYLFPSFSFCLLLSCTACSWQQRGRVYFLHFKACCQMWPLPPYPFFAHTANREHFLLLLDVVLKKKSLSFTPSVWATPKLHISNQKWRFWRLKRALWNAASTNTQTTQPHLTPQPSKTPNISFFKPWRGAEKRYLWKQTALTV